MSPELDAALVRDFPKLYRDRHGDPKETCMWEGFSCDDGWEPIIRALSAVLTSHDRRRVLRATQVKEKFGTLAFYLAMSDEFTIGASTMATVLSSMTCERCGAPAAALASRHGQRYGWMKTLCAEHAREWTAPPPPPAG